MPGPLAGLKVLDFTTLLPGPYATMMMADMGAEVLCIRAPDRPAFNNLAPPFIPGTEISSTTAWLRRGKRSMHLNLKDDRATGVVHRLLAGHDVLVEQFRPGVMARLGLDYPAVRKVNPAVIYCSITGYGQTGPLAHRAGHDINYLARSGIMSYSGRRAGGPVLFGSQVADLTGGSCHAVIGILAAVVHRTFTGQGQFIDVSMADGMAALNCMRGAAFLVDEKVPCYEDSRLNGGSLYDFYETLDGKYLSVGCLEPQFFASFCDAVGRPDLSSGSVMPGDVDGVKEQLRVVIGTKTRDEWEAVFAGTDACVEPVLDLREAYAQPLAREREWIVEVPLSDGTPVKQPGVPIRFSETPARPTTAGGRADEHTREVMSGLGYTEDEIGEFQKTGLFGKCA